MTTTSLDHRMNIKTIVWPIFVESLLRMSMMSVDVFMLSRYSEDAVAAVGLAGYFIFFLALTYMIVSTGSAILIGQSLGAGKPKESQAYAQSGFLLALILSLVVGALFYASNGAMVSFYDLAPNVETYARQYVTLVGALSVGMSISIMLSTLLRAHGYSKSPMVIQLLSGLVNVAGNYIALFGPFGLPVTGVPGVAIATVASQIFAAVACLVVIKHHRLPFSIRQSMRFDGQRFKEIVKLGLPNAGEGLSYNMAQMAIMFFITQLGTAALAAVAIAMNLSRFMFVFSMSLGQGAQILSSYLCGQGREQELKQKVHRYWMAGVAVSFVVTLLMVFGREPVAALFTDDLETQQLIGLLLIVSLLLEPGRAINLIVISALKGAADVVFPVKMGIISMWGVGVVFAYLFGLHWGFGLAGIWLGVACDEWLRGIIMIVRWQKDKWVGKTKISAEPKPDQSSPEQTNAQLASEPSAA